MRYLIIFISFYLTLFAKDCYWNKDHQRVCYKRFYNLDELKKPRDNEVYYIFPSGKVYGMSDKIVLKLNYKGGIIDLGNHIKLYKQDGILELGRQKIALNSFFVVGHDSQGKLQKTRQVVNLQSPLSIVFMRDYNKILVLDQKMFASLYIQLFVFENYDKDLFEPVVISPYVKIFKLKR